MARFYFWVTPPARGAPRLERLLWFQGYYVRQALLIVPILIVGALWSTVVLILALVGLGIELAMFLLGVKQIRAERQRAA